MPKKAKSFITFYVFFSFGLLTVVGYKAYSWPCTEIIDGLRQRWIAPQNLEDVIITNHPALQRVRDHQDEFLRFGGVWDKIAFLKVLEKLNSSLEGKFTVYPLAGQMYFFFEKDDQVYHLSKTYRQFYLSSKIPAEISNLRPGLNLEQRFQRPGSQELFLTGFTRAWNDLLVPVYSSKSTVFYIHFSSSSDEESWNCDAKIFGYLRRSEVPLISFSSIDFLGADCRKLSKSELMKVEPVELSPRELSGLWRVAKNLKTRIFTLVQGRKDVHQPQPHYTALTLSPDSELGTIGVLLEDQIPVLRIISGRETATLVVVDD